MQGEPHIGAELAGYRLVSLVSRGGMAVVYLAEDLRLGRSVALKILALELSEDERFRVRFLRESKTAASIDHPHVIPIYDAGEAAGHLFIAMRHVPGADLRSLISAEAPLEIARSITIAIQIASALGAAHERGLVHRDIKPANVLMIPRSGTGAADHAYLSDFGLAKHVTSVSGLTETGHFIGTVSYAAPEQIEGKPVDGRTDIYSLGCLLFECLTGQPPFVQEEGVAVVMAHLREEPPLVTDLRGDCPPELAGIVGKMLAKAPADRQQDCAELVSELRAIGSAHPESTLSQTRSFAGPQSSGDASQEPRGGRLRGAPVRAILALLVLAAAVIGIVAVTGGGETTEPASQTAGTIEGGAAWRPLDDAPTARQQAAGAWLDGKVWVVGGLEGESASTATTSVEAFDPATESWSDGPDLPVPLHHAVARNFQGQLVVIGGWISDQPGDLPGETSGRVYALRDREWVRLPDLNHARSAAAAAVVGGELIVTGGQADGELVPQVEAFDGERWRDVAPLPTPREHLAAASDGRYVYVLGGRELSSESNLGTLERYDPVSDRWTELPSMPTPIGSFDAAIAMGHLIAVGGEEPLGVSGKVEAYDLQTRKWSSLPPLGVPRHGLTVALHGGLLYALVGAEETAHSQSTAAAEVIDLTAVFGAAPPVGEWRELASAPEPRQQTASAVLGGRLWLLGGLEGEAGSEATASAVAYDPVINGWNAGPDLPIALHHATAAVYEGELVVIGGWEPEGSNLSAITSGRVFALRNGEWVELPELNHPRVAGGAAVVGDKLIVTGGQADGELVAETEVFDGETWTDAAPIPTPREHLAVAADDRHVYAVGGRELTADKNLATLERYDPATDAWATMPEMPVATGGFGAAIVGDQLVAVGGEESLDVIEAVQAFDLESNTWSTLPPMIQSRHGHAVLALGSTLYAVAGALEPGHTGSTDSAEALDFD